MDITFSGGKFEKECNSVRLLERRYGVPRARRISLRLQQLAAAETLEDLRNLPGRCHELRGDRAGQFSLDLDGPYRLLFVPTNEPLPKKKDGGIAWKGVTAVCILSIEDTHE
ncbi:MAG: killer suppression protein [Gemmatimonadaceae bacterium]|nr:killer suppression protein [Gloeobacterales cyanobacterium ES-bin-141]